MSLGRKVFGRHHDLVVTDVHGYVPFVVVIILSSIVHELSLNMTYRIFIMRNTAGVASEEGTAYTSGIFTFIFVRRARVAQSYFSVYYFVRMFLSPFLWPLYCLSFYLRFLITNLVYSNFS